MSNYIKNDIYFTQHFSELISKYGGKWIVIAGGKKIGIGPKQNLNILITDAKKRYPKDIPMIAPIPTEEEIQCIL